MERIFKLAKQIYILKGKYGQNVVPFKWDKPGSCLEALLKEKGVESVVRMVDKVKEEIEIPPIGDMAERTLAFYAALHAIIEPHRKGFITSFKTDNWQKTQCPFCGSKAGLSHISENGKRKLICHFCWTEWEYPRLKCFNCERENGSYALFEVERHEVRVDYCDDCKSYIKTVAFEFSEDPYVIWDLKTLSLDEWAMAKGYKKPTPSMVGIDFTK